MHCRILITFIQTLFLFLFTSLTCTAQNNFWNSIEKGRYESLAVSEILDSLNSLKNFDQSKIEKLISLTNDYVLTQGSKEDKAKFYLSKSYIQESQTTYADSSLHFAKLLNDTTLIAEAMMELASIYNGTGKNEIAILSYEKLIELTTSPQVHYDAYLGIAGVYLDVMSFEEAKNYLLQAKMILKELPRKEHYKLYSSYGYIYLNSSQLDSSKYYYQMAYDICEDYNLGNKKLTYLENLGIIELDLGNVELAENLFLQVLNEAEKIDSELLMLYACTDLSYLFYHKKDYDKAMFYGNKEFELANELGNIRYQMNAAIKLSNSNKRIGDFENALKYYQIFKLRSDSLTNVKNVRKLTELRVKNEFKNEHLIDSLNLATANLALTAEKSKRKSITWLFIITLIGGLFSAWQFFRAKKAQKRSDELLLNILPKSTAEELKVTGSTTSKRYDKVSILFADMVNFTLISRRLSPEELVKMLDDYFGYFDQILKKWNVEKIKTIGDAYMAVYGVPEGNEARTINVINAALEMQQFVKSNATKYESKLGGIKISMRIGIHTGSLVAGVVGNTKFQFDVWGDAVNIAARIESAGEAGKINVSNETYQFIKNNVSFKFIPRGNVEVKNIGEIEMFFVEEKHLALASA